MKLPRRKFLHLAAGAVALPVVSRAAWGQVYPSRPIRIIVSVAAGGVDDLLVGLLEHRLPERLGQPVRIDNQPDVGAYTKAITNASPDGYTFVLVIAANAVSVVLGQGLNFDFARDMAPVAGISRNPFFVVVNPSVPVRTIPEFIAYAKANPGNVNMASTGNASRIAGELFKMMTGVELVHVPFAGAAAAITGLLSGQVQVMFATIPASVQSIREGKLRALAITSATRSELMPDIPMVGDFVAGYEASGFQGLGAPRNTPAEPIDRLNKEINAALADPEFKASLTKFGNTALPLPPADFGKLMRDEIDKLTKVIKFAGMKG
ncbi:MAG: hypothetical protein QOI12_3755 [Alphaproteobacteria bacterium]|jgi:tripartite-type tricarboxylate transporter receptor subunit TctC|nr:hypothetical protein [Alphaproteobacteria bacterium]